MRITPRITRLVRFSVLSVERDRLNPVEDDFVSDGGFLEVGTNGRGEVVINHPDLEPDENGVGHIVFSPEEAINLARILLKKAAEAEGEL